MIQKTFSVSALALVLLAGVLLTGCGERRGEVPELTPAQKLAQYLAVIQTPEEAQMSQQEVAELVAEVNAAEPAGTPEDEQAREQIPEEVERLRQQGALGPLEDSLNDLEL